MNSVTGEMDVGDLVMGIQVQVKKQTHHSLLGGLPRRVEERGGRGQGALRPRVISAEVEVSLMPTGDSQERNDSPGRQWT